MWCLHPRAGLRLNQGNNFANGIYTPYNLRIGTSQNIIISIHIVIAPILNCFGTINMQTVVSPLAIYFELHIDGCLNVGNGQTTICGNTITTSSLIVQGVNLNTLLASGFLKLSFFCVSYNCWLFICILLLAANPGYTYLTGLVNALASAVLLNPVRTLIFLCVPILPNFLGPSVWLLPF